MSNEMKPGWEETFMAQDIFTQAVAEFMARNHASVGFPNWTEDEAEKLKRLADVAMNASTIFHQRRTERKFPPTVTEGNIADE
jgi:hypothetical protein